MAKPLDPKAIEAERQTSSRAERREQKRRQMQDEISYNQRGNGVIIIPPQKRRELAEEPPKLRVAAYCRVSTQEEQQVGSFDMQIHHFTPRGLRQIRNGSWLRFIKMRVSARLPLKSASAFRR